ncbi:MAG: hypothetical protein KW802_03975 [Candidatus Doudnabacteria bacterium]|nr:hypothetical protein [Candidatus Doudnabacteria bacterium]
MQTTAQVVLIVIGDIIPDSLYTRYAKIALFAPSNFLEHEFSEHENLRAVIFYGDKIDRAQRNAIEAWARADSRRYQIRTAETPFMLEAYLKQYESLHPKDINARHKEQQARQKQ